MPDTFNVYLYESKHLYNLIVPVDNLLIVISF